MAIATEKNSMILVRYVALLTILTNSVWLPRCMEGHHLL